MVWRNGSSGFKDLGSVDGSDWALAGVRVLEIAGGVAAASCARVLRGFGADTIRVDTPNDQLSAAERLFFTSGTGQRDLASLGELIDQADVIIEDQRPGWLGAPGV